MSTPENERLVERLKPAAVAACGNAHARYSRFPVGAALITDDADVFVGCNVENASYGLTICAERNALVQAVAQGMRPGQARFLLIYTPGDAAHSPCGACRQVMHELLNERATVVSTCDSQATRVWTMQQLIPDPFEF